MTSDSADEVQGIFADVLDAAVNSPSLMESAA
jgi:hypothetical protein